MARWTINCFPIWYFVTLRTLVKILVNLQKWKYSLAKEQLSQKVVLFSDLLNELCFLFKCGFEIAELISFMATWVRRCKTIVFDLNLRTNDLFGKLFPSLQCPTNAYLFSNVFCGLAQTLTLNVGTKLEK